MKTYEIIQTTSGQSLGTYEAVDAASAIREMMDDAGASDEEPDPGLLAVEVEDSEE